MKKTVIKVLAGVAVLALFGLVGSMDYEDAVNAERHYCNMVAEGLWPAYRDDIDCSK
jgi:hypothetical protein